MNSTLTTYGYLKLDAKMVLEGGIWWFSYWMLFVLVEIFAFATANLIDVWQYTILLVKWSMCSRVTRQSSLWTIFSYFINFLCAKMTKPLFFCSLVGTRLVFQELSDHWTNRSATCMSTFSIYLPVYTTVISWMACVMPKQCYLMVMGCCELLNKNSVAL